VPPLLRAFLPLPLLLLSSIHAMAMWTTAYASVPARGCSAFHFAQSTRAQAPPRALLTLLRAVLLSSGQAVADPLACCSISLLKSSHAVGGVGFALLEAALLIDRLLGAERLCV
jgi:hypothetical protein